MAETVKVCIECGEEKPVGEFGAHSITDDLLRTRCKVCYNAYQRELRAAKRAGVVRGEATKRCSRCRYFWPLSSFGNDRSQKDGLHWQCSPCRRHITSEKRRRLRGENVDTYEAEGTHQLPPGDARKLTGGFRVKAVEVAKEQVVKRLAGGGGDAVLHDLHKDLIAFGDWLALVEDDGVAEAVELWRRCEETVRSQIAKGAS